jgi:hypothetical protein
MKLETFIWKALLLVVLPFAFVVVSTVLIAGIMAALGALMGHNTFTSCFQGIIENGILIAAMSLTAIAGTIFYLSTIE